MAILITRCKDLKLSAFIECLCMGNLRALVVRGEVSEQELKAAWDNILMEFNELAADDNARSMMLKRNEASALQSNVSRIRLLLYAVSEVRDPAMLAELEADGYAVEAEADAAGADEWAQAISRQLSILKSDELLLEELTDALPTAGPGAGTPSAESFDAMLTQICVWLKQDLYPERITVARYCGYLKSYRAEQIRRSKLKTPAAAMADVD